MTDNLHDAHLRMARAMLPHFSGTPAVADHITDEAPTAPVVEPTTPGPLPGVNDVTKAKLDAIEVDLRGGYVRSGEHIAEDPDEYRDEQFVNVADLPSIIHAWATAALPVLNTTKDAECVRDLLQAVYPGDPMPDRPLDTVWNHLLEKVRGDCADADRWRMLRLEPLGMEIGSPDEAYVRRIRERLNDWFNVRAEKKLCCCGQPTTLDTVHRAEAPCYVAEAAASLRGEQ